MCAILSAMKKVTRTLRLDGVKGSVLRLREPAGRRRDQEGHRVGLNDISGGFEGPSRVDQARGGVESDYAFKDHSPPKPSGPRSSSENILDKVVSSALASLSAEIMEGVLSALSTAPM